MKTVHLFLALTATTFLAAACSKSPPPEKAETSHHTHPAPHGGTLVELGDHVYNLELLRDPAAGNLTAWILDGHAENFVRISSRTITLVVLADGKPTPLMLSAVANSATSETVGDTSQFEVQAEWLKSAGGFAGTVTLEIKGRKFNLVPFQLGK